MNKKNVMKLPKSICALAVLLGVILLPNLVHAETVVATIATGTAPYVAAVNQVTNKIYVATQNNMAVIDGVTGETANVALGSNPDAISVAVNPVTNKIYVANYTNANLTVIDGASNTITNVSTGSNPIAVAVNPITNKIYVANQGDNNVTVIDGTNNATTTVSDAAAMAPRAVAVNPVTNKIYVANNGSNNLTVIDGVTNATVTVPAGTNPFAVAVNPVTNEIYVVNQGSNDVTVIDGTTNTTTTVSAGNFPYAIAVNPVTNIIYVANQGNNNITVIDGGTNTTATIAVGANPSAVAVNPITNKIYVANTNSKNVTVVDGATNTTTTVADATAIDPRAVAVNPVTNKIYIVNYNSANVTVIDGADYTPNNVPAGTNPRAVAVNPVTNKIYVANNSSDNVTVIDGATQTTTTVAVGAQPFAVAVNPITNRIYVANYNSNNVTVINGATNTTTTITDLSATNPNALGVNPVTNKIYVANYNSSSVTVIDGATNTTLTVAADAQPYAVAVNPVTNKIYVANLIGNNVTVIDGATNTTATVPVGTNPYAVAVNPVTNKIYVANANSSNVTVIDGATNATATIAADTGPYDLAVNPVTNKIYVASYFSIYVTVIDGATNTATAVTAGTYPSAVAVNPVANTIYVLNNGGDNVTEIDGATHTTTTIPAGSQPMALAVNPVTNNIYVANYNSGNVTVISPSTPQPSFLQTSISEFQNNIAPSETPTFTISASSLFAPNAPPVQNIYYQLDTQMGAWTLAGAGSSATFSTPALQLGLHTIFAYATDGQDATSTNLDSPLPGNIAAYTFVVTISKTATVKLSGLNLTYNGTQQTATVTTSPPGLATSVTYNGSTTAPKNAGTYEVNATVIDPNYTGSASGTLVIAQSNQTITFNPISNPTYGNSAFPLLASSDSGLAVTYSVLSGPATVNGNTLTMTGAGSVTVQASQSGDANRSAATPVSQTFAVNPAALSITANDAAKVFNTTNPAFNAKYSGFVNGDTAAGLTGTLSLTTTAVAASNAGTYPITPSGLSSSNYAITFNTGTLTVTKAPATVNLSGLSVTYNGTPQRVTFTTTPAGLAASVTYDGSTTAPANAGTYALTASITDPNYSGSASGTLVIAQASQAITFYFGSNIDTTYGASAFPLYATSDSGLAVSFDVESGPATVVGNTLTMTGAGIVTVQASQSGNSNYIAAKPSYLTFTVGRKAATINAADLTKVYNTPNPEFYVTYSGFYNYDWEGLDGTLSFSTIADTGSKVGTYLIMPSGLSSPNYAITFNIGILTVTKATPVITWAAPAAIDSATALSATQLNATANVPGQFVYQPASGTLLPPGANQALTAIFTPTDSTNYNPATMSVHIDVNNPPLIITSLPVGAPNPAVAGQTVVFVASATGTGPLNYIWNFGDALYAKGNLVSHSFGTAGTYVVTLTVTDALNATVTATINEKVNALSGTGAGGAFVISSANGIPDQLQGAASAAGIASVPASQELADVKLAISLNFAKKGNDSIVLSGTLIHPQGFSADGQPVIVDVGGVLKTFKLNAQGKAETADGLFTIDLKGTSAATSKFTMKLHKGTFASTLSSVGLSNNISNAKDVSVPVAVLFAGDLYISSHTETYTANSKSGMARDAK